MTGLEENRLSMYLSFKEYYTPYEAIIKALPNFSANHTLFESTVNQIQQLAEQQKISKKGIAESKNQQRANLVVLTADYARKLSAYARFNNNLNLAQEVKFSESKLKQVTDTAVKDYAQIVYDRAQNNLTSLASYGITAETQTTLKDAITAYNATIGKPGASRTESGLITQQLKALFKTADAVLENMDTAVEIIRLSQPNFYSGYQKARKVINTGGSSLAVKAQVTDATTGKPIKGATVSFTSDGGATLTKAASAKPEIIKKTADKGGLKLKSLTAGIYKVSINKTGFTEQVCTLAVSEGEMAELNVELSRN